MPSRRSPGIRRSGSIAAAAIALAFSGCPGSAGHGHDARSGEDVADRAATEAGSHDALPQLALSAAGKKTLKGAVEDFRAGRFAAAAEVLSAPGAEGGILEDYRLYYLAESLFLDGRPAEAAPVFQKLANMKGSRFARLAPFRAADSMLESGDPGAAAEEYASLAARGIPATVDSASVHYMWARALEQGGRSRAAIERYEHVAMQFPSRPQADLALEAIARLSPGWKLGSSQRVDRARRLIDEKRWAEAAVELEGIGEDLPPARAREAALMRASAVYQKRNAWAEAQALFEPLAKGKDAVAAEAGYMAIRCMQRRGLTVKAASAFKSYLARFESSPFRDDALMQLLVMDYEAGRWKAVRTRHLKHLRGGVWSGEDRANALWMIAFSCHLEGRDDQALALLGEYEAQATEGMSRARAEYWQGVVSLALGREGDAAASFEKVAKRWPLHYYALLASRRLEDMGREPPDPAGILGKPGAAKAGPSSCEGLPPVVAALLDAGLDHDAREEMKRGKEALVKSHGSDPEALARIHACAGTESLVIGHASAMEEDPSAGDGERMAWWRLVYPEPRRAEVEASASAAGVPALLAFSIIRQESMFDPDAVSQTRAGGLMQLMPATAAGVAKDLGEPYSEDAVFDPETNVRWGTAYLGRLIAMFPGNVPAAIGAYNGGPHNMARWLHAHAPVPGDVFVELIPYAQTRNYVRRVLTSWARYEYLDTGSWAAAMERLPRTMTAETGEGPGY